MPRRLSRGHRLRRRSMPTHTRLPSRPIFRGSEKVRNRRTMHFAVRAISTFPFRQFIMITECTLLLSSRYIKWLIVSVIHHLWSNEECTNAVMADWWLCLRLRISFAFCLELGHWNFTHTLGTGTWYCQHC